MDQNGQLFKIIAHIRTDFPAKFGIPRQSGLIEELEGTVVFTPEYRNPAALKGLEGYSHIWLLWQFSAAMREKFQPTVRPPRLGGNEKMGVFATRSPFRPNPIGLSLVKLEKIEPAHGLGTVLRVRGADLMDRTPIFDIKPYLPYADCRPEARGGFTDGLTEQALDVDFPLRLLELLPPERRTAAVEVLRHDPRPAYQEDGRTYGMTFAGFNISFTVSGSRLTVTAVAPAKH